MTDPDLELRRGGGSGLDLLALSTIFPSVISSFFTQNKGGPGPPVPSPRSATGPNIYIDDKKHFVEGKRISLVVIQRLMRKK